MPAQDYWETLLDVPRILAAFGFGAHTGGGAAGLGRLGTAAAAMTRLVRDGRGPSL